MKKNPYFLNTALALVLGAGCLVYGLLRMCLPGVVLPRLDVPAMVAVSLAALLLDHYVAGQTRRCWVCIPVLGALTFGLLSWAACLADGPEALELGVLGGVVFGVTAWLFTSIQDRLSTGPAARFAPVASAVCLFLASQVFMGM